MKALVTGGSSGIGKDIAIKLSQLGYDIILVSRSEIELQKVKEKIKTNCEIIVADLSKRVDVEKVIRKAKNEKIDILINNAGFGIYGEFTDISIEKEIDMLNVNAVCLHMLTKEIYKMMAQQNFGYILNVSSSAGLMPGGPLLTSYYATKSYVTSLTLGLYEENRRNKKNVHISILCPGPVDTNFNKVAGTKFNISSLSSEKVAKIAINKMFKKKLIIVPGLKIKIGLFFQRILSIKFILKISYEIQNKKRGKN